MNSFSAARPAGPLARGAQPGAAQLGAALCFALAALSAGCPNAKAPTPPPPPPPASPGAPQPSVSQLPQDGGPALEGPARTRLYPARIAPPEGQQWPSPITPLPDPLEGIPRADVKYVETVYTVTLEAIDARIRMLHSLKRFQEGKPLLQGGQQVSMKDMHRRYQDATSALVTRLDQLDPPGPLAKFHQALLEGIKQQLLLFNKARETKLPVARLNELSAGKRAKYHCGRAWGLFKQAYPELGADTAAACKSHLTALAPF